MKKVKMYAVEFINYTNCLKNCVSTYDDSKSYEEQIKDVKYLDIGSDPLIIAENEFEEYSKYGGGFKSLTFVGNYIC